MASLTPISRKEEVTGQAMNEGLLNGTMILLPSMAGLYGAMQNAKFRKFTNWQSRTAIVIMPALFIFALTSEHKVSHRMREIANETEHAVKSVEWAERQKNSTPEEIQLHDLYRQSVLGSGIRLVDGNELGVHHKAANFVQANPFKCIGGVGIPAVAYIFRGQGGSANLQLQILHTRVFGQFAVICTLLGVMGLKEMMDRGGRYVTDEEIEDRVNEMESTRNSMMERLEYQAKQQADRMKRNGKKQQKE